MARMLLSGRPRGRFNVVQIISALVVLLLGCFMLARRSSAQPAPQGQKPVVKLGVGAPPGSPVPPGASAAPAAAPAAKEDKKDDKKGDKDDKKGDKKDDKGDYEEPVDYAVAGPEGGVPIHNEGRYKSPFAHPHFGGPAKVKVGILLANLNGYDIKEGTFNADFYLSFTSDKPMPPMNPGFTNGKVEEKTVVADKPTFKLYHFLGSFITPPDLHHYPFDTQELTIEIEDDDNGTDQMVLTADQEHTNLDVGFQVPGWETSFLKAEVMDHYFPDRFENDDLYYSRYKFTLGIARYGTSAAFTVFVPAFVIVLISLTGLWLPREELEVRSNASAPMLAAAVLFHFTLTQALPPTAYLTRADKLMMAVYISLLVNMLATWAWFIFHEKHEHTIFLWGRRVVPPLTICFMLAGSFL